MLRNDILSCSTCKKSSISKETDIRSLEGAKEGCRQSRLCAAGTCVRFEAGVLVLALSCLSLHVSLTVGRAEVPTLQMGVAHYAWHVPAKVVLWAEGGQGCQVQTRVL